MTEATGEFHRYPTTSPTRITADGRDGYPVEPGRYRLVVAAPARGPTAPIIVRRLLGLEDAISMGVVRADPRRAQLDLRPRPGRPSTRCSASSASQDAYLARDPDYARGSPCRPSSTSRPAQVVTNDFAQITLDLSTEWREYHRAGAPDLYPDELRDEIDEVNERVFPDVNNGVYRCGFAGTPGGLRRGVRPALRAPRLARASGWPTSATSSATRSPRPTSGCSRRWPASTRSTTATSSATGRS